MFPVVETSPNSKGVASKLIKFGLTVLVGGNRFSHTIFLGDSNHIYERLFGLKKMVKSSTAITRLFNKIKTFEDSMKLSESLWSYTFNEIIPFKKIQSDYLNFDSKVITRYGEQEGAEVGYNPKKKGRVSHHPNMAFLNESKYIVNFWNRSGNSSSGNGVVEFLKETLTRLGDRLSIKACICDSGYYKIDLLKHLESIQIDYIVGVPFYQTLQRVFLEQKDWLEVEEGLCVTSFEFEHKSKNWDKKRRYILIRQDKKLKEKAKGKQLNLFKEDDDLSKYRYTCLITSLSDSPLEVWRTYRKRANDENIIKENTYDFGLEGFSLNNFYATEAAMLIRILFYNLINFFRNEILPEKEKKSRLQTLRYKYLVIPAQMGSDGRKMVLRLGIKLKAFRERIRWILNKIETYFNERSKCIAFDSG